MEAARKDNEQAAVLYLNTDRRGPAAATLAHQLYVVLDSRLPARLPDLSDQPEGSRANPLKPDEDVIGTIATADGSLDLVLERVGRTWLFSRKTLNAIPEVFAEIDLVSVDRYLPDFLAKRRIGGIRLFEWLAALLLIPIVYMLIGLVGRIVRPVFAFLQRRYAWAGWLLELLAGPMRLFVLAGSIRWTVSVLQLPLIERVFWSTARTLILTAAVVWVLLRMNGSVERTIKQRLQAATVGEMSAMLRLARRLVDILIVAMGVVVLLQYFGVDPTAALAGLGLGGIAVALAAQKTLENVIGGVSIVIDKAVRVGDFLKIGDLQGTVDYVGLRSTRIRTLDRTILTVPNGQIATVNIETLSARDKFWFHHIVSVRYETTPDQMRAVIEGIYALLKAHPGVDQGMVRVRFLRFGPYALEIEVFTYIFATDWERFLDVQQELLLSVMGVVDEAGTALALPSQILHVAEGSRQKL